MQHRHDMQQLLETLDPKYEKDVKHVDFPRYASGYEQAIKRAIRLDAIADEVGTPGHNPTTNVYELTELILKGRNLDDGPPFGATGGDEPSPQAEVLPSAFD